MPTLLCVPILVVDEAAAHEDAIAARDGGADLVEFRVDEFFSGAAGPEGRPDEREVSAILRLVARSPLPCIVTCRSAAEGGHYEGDEAARVSLLERLGTAEPRSEPGDGALEHPPRYIDFEFASYTRSANIRQKIDLAVDHPSQRRDVRTGLILSMHDLAGRPRDLLRRVADMAAEPAASVVKIAYTARSVRDNLELLDLLAENAAGRPMIALGMGRFGLLSRVLAPKFGGFLTFASLRPGAQTAPGQPTLRELLDVYRVRAIGPRTRVYGLIGYPVEHSLSPLVHNAGFEAYRPEPHAADEHDGVYLPLPVPAEYEHFKATAAALIDHPRLGFCGCSVTAPHKQHLVRFAREARAAAEIPWDIDELSERCGAANTLVIERDARGAPRRAGVLNTDAAAAAASLEEALGPLDGRQVGLIGAGGVARAVAAGLLARGASVVIYNRTRDNAARLAADLAAASAGGASPGITAATTDEIGRIPCDALVNCTPVGMTGGPDETGVPIDVQSLRTGSPHAVVMDTVYTPLLTPLLRAAQAAGLRTLDGVGMFVRQAAAQFEAWTGRAAPLRLFERICRDALGEETGTR